MKNLIIKVEDDGKQKRQSFTVSLELFDFCCDSNLTLDIEAYGATEVAARGELKKVVSELLQTLNAV